MNEQSTAVLTPTEELAVQPKETIKLKSNNVLSADRVRPAIVKVNRYEQTYNDILETLPVTQLEHESNPYDGCSSKDIKLILNERCRLLQENRMCCFFMNHFFLYNGWYHEIDSRYNSHIHIGRMLHSMGIPDTYPNINYSHKQLRATAFTSPQLLPDSPNMVLYNNGILNTQDNCLYSRSPMYFATGAIQANYNPYLSNQHPVFDKFLLDAACGDICLITRIWEVLGYLLSPDYNAKRFFIFYGAGDAGKNVLIDVIRKLLTPSLIKNLSLENLFGSRFALSEIAFRRINFSSDQGVVHLSSSQAGLLKRITGGRDELTADVKGQAQTTFPATCKLVIASNHPIHIASSINDDSIKRRILAIPFLRSVPKSEQDPYLSDKILMERDSIVTDALYYYKGLRNRGYVFSGDGCHYDKEAAEVPGVIDYTDLIEFSKQYCIFDSESFTPSQRLFERFKELYPHNLTYTNTESFSQAFAALNSAQINNKRKRTEYGNLRGFEGVHIEGGN